MFVICIILRALLFVLGVLCFVVIFANITQKFEKQNLTKLDFLFMFILLCVGISCMYGMRVVGKQMDTYEKSTRTIENIKEIVIKEIVEWDIDDTYFVPTGRSLVKRVYLITESGRTVRLGAMKKNIDYEKLYPIGDTITINGRYVVFRRH